MDTTCDQPASHAAADYAGQSWWNWPLAILIAVFFTASSLYISAHRQLWFDEILTALVCRLPSLRMMWTALSEIEEQTPPLYFVIVRACDQVFHHADVGLRVPSALALGTGLLIVYDTARRLTDGTYGLVAMSLVATPFVAYYGSEARSYAIYFLCASIALWLWVATNAESNFAAAAFGAVFLVGVAIHYYFVLCLLPFGIMALSERRIFQSKIVAASAGIMVSLAVLYPQIAKSKQFVTSVSEISAPSIGKLLEAYHKFAPNAVLLVAAAAACVLVFGRSRERHLPPMGSGERVGWYFFVLPVAVYALGLVLTHLFHDRYAIGAGPGMAIAATCLLWRTCRERKYLSAALLLAFSSYAIIQQVRTVKTVDYIKSDSGDYQERTRQVLAMEDILQDDGKKHVVLSWDVEYLETWYYSKHRDLYECITSENRWTIKNYVPLHFVSLEDITANTAQTALITPTPALLRSLAGKGLRIRVRSAQSQSVLDYFK